MTPDERVAEIEKNVWTPRTVAEIFRATFVVVRATALTARDRPQRLRATWPESAPDFWGEYGRHEIPENRLIPTSAQILQAEMCLQWALDIGDRRIRRLVTGRALKVPYASLRARDGRSGQYLRALVSREHSRIAQVLNTWRVRPEEFRELRKLG